MGSKNSFQISHKPDGSPVTELDYAISAIFERFCHTNTLHLISEENTTRDFHYPLMVLDPLDGTREFIAGIAEFAISCAIYHQDDWQQGEAWILNLATGEQANSHSLPTLEPCLPQPTSTYVSRSESPLRLSALEAHYHCQSLGSIAYKLLKLATGKCDFILSSRPKNIWDIAAGTSLCQKQGIHLYNQQGAIVSLEKIRFQSPLLWCRPQHFEQLQRVLK